MKSEIENWLTGLHEALKVELQGEIAIISLNRPQKRNALSDNLVVGLDKLLSGVPKSVRVIVLRGEGEHFCAGLDLNEVNASEGIEFDTSVNGQRLNNTIQFCKTPVISVLHGAVIGGGLEIAAASHIRVAERSAFYALPEGTRGIFLGSGGSVRLPRLIGPAAVMDMMLSGRVYDAESAHSTLRLSQYLVDDGEGLNQALEIAGKVARNSVLSNFAIIQALPRIADNDQTTGLFTEMLMASVAADDGEAKARLREFLELKRNKVTKD